MTKLILFTDLVPAASDDGSKYRWATIVGVSSADHCFCIRVDAPVVNARSASRVQLSISV